VLRRISAQTASLVLHLTAIALLVGVRTMAPPREPSVAVESAAPDATEPPASDQPLPSDPEPEIGNGGGFEVSRLRVGELNVDIAKIRARSAVLFPFLTLDLKFLERMPQDIQKSRQRLVNPNSAAAQGATS
jgi:hypothetical protein